MGPLIGSQTEQRQLPLLPPPFVLAFVTGPEGIPVGRYRQPSGGSCRVCVKNLSRTSSGNMPGAALVHVPATKELNGELLQATKPAEGEKMN